LNYN